MTATALEIVGASVFGLLVGQLTTGIPLAMRLHRHERPPRPPLPDLGTVILDDWPDDRAAELLAAW